MPFPEITSAVFFFPEQVGIENLKSFRRDTVTFAFLTVSSCSDSSQNGRTAGPADRVAYESLFKSGAPCGQSIDVRCFHYRVSIASNCACGLIVGEEEDDVGRLCSVTGAYKRNENKNEKAEISHDVGC